jgi:hypothetical protein
MKSSPAGLEPSTAVTSEREPDEQGRSGSCSIGGLGSEEATQPVDLVADPGEPQAVPGERVVR